MLRVERSVRFPDGKDEVQEFAHAMADGDIAAFALGFEAGIQGAEGGVVADAGACGVPQIMANQIVSLGRHHQGARRQRIAFLVDAGTVLFGKDPEIADEVVGTGEAVDVDDLGGEDGGGGAADAGDGDQLAVAGRGQIGEGGVEQYTHVLLGVFAVPHFGDEGADQRAGDIAPERTDRRLGRLVQGLGRLLGQIGNVLHRSEPRLGDRFRVGIFVEQIQDPGGSEIVGQGGEFGKNAGHEIVQAVNGASGLPDLGLESASDLVQESHGGRRRGRGGGQLDNGEARHGLAFGVVGRAFGEVSLLIILVAFGFADRQGDGQFETAEKAFEIGGVLPRRVDANVKVGLGMLLPKEFEAFLKGTIAELAFENGERLGGGSPIGSQKGNTMSISCGIDPDADAFEGFLSGGGRHGRISARATENRRLGWPKGHGERTRSRERA